MRRAIQTHKSGHWPEEGAISSITLPLDQRHRRRFRMTDDDDQVFLLDLPEAILLGDGDGLELEDGGIIRVTAADEAVCDVAGKTPAHTARLAWHIGNRHTAVQVVDDTTLRILDDHVMAHMLEGLGATVRRVTAPFSPEPGAYAGHGHDH
ncbi:MAG: urease accessory protein UreE [Paracoccaceae bacterium]|jgi:urease accessory protein|nr:urease accessory protein UreE [Paracoccaceae bacterium]HJO75415.1 urease accessory protein UreE [Rhodospirillales bacterium]